MESPDESFLSPDDIAKRLNICYQKSLDFIKYSGLPYLKIGRTYRVSVKVFYDFVLKNERQEFNLEQLQYNNLKAKGGF